MREEIDQSIRQWIVRKASKNYWRVAAYYELEDLIQDGVMVYYRVQAKYADTGKTRDHVRNIFKASFTNHIHDLSSKRTRNPVEVHIDDLVPAGSAPDYADRFLPVDPETQTFMTMLAQAPQKVREVLKLFTSEDSLRVLRANYRFRPDGVRETLNERLCNLAGFDPERVDLVTTLRGYFSEA